LGFAGFFVRVFSNPSIFVCSFTQTQRKEFSKCANESDGQCKQDWQEKIQKAIASNYIEFILRVGVQGFVNLTKLFFRRIFI
jgi:hypothetical protein